MQKILEKQSQFHTKLQDFSLYKKCVKELYPNNESQQQSILNKNFVYLFLEDIIFYQRPLKSQKSNISGCAYESRSYKKITDGKEEIINEPIKCIPKSHPLYQEFRLWQFLKNLKIYQREAIVDDKIRIDHNITDVLFQSEDDWCSLFDFLDKRKDVEQKHIIDFLIKQGKISKKDKNNYRWNYVEDKAYPANKTKALFISRLEKVNDINIENIYTKEFEQNLWHIVYSVTDKKEFKKALQTFAQKNSINVDSFVENFIKTPPFDSEYGAYSLKAIKKLLPLMRRGKYWKNEDISEDIVNKAKDIRERLQSIDFNKSKIEEVADDDLQKQVLKSFIDFADKNMTQGLNTFQACYMVYGRHSEALESAKWIVPSDIDYYLKHIFKQHSLRNPIVEQVVTETLRVVRDIWDYYGNGKQDFFDEIHVELGRDMKNPAGKRQDMAKRQQENENTNIRIKEILKELMNDSSVEGDIRPFSPSQQELLKIYEEGIFQNPNADYRKLTEDDVKTIRKKSKPSANDITRYKLWLEQGYCSPYTGKMISLSKLFTRAYDIEHIIPQARYFDNSLSNKIICESEVNELKSNMTAYEFITQKGGSLVDLQKGKTIKILTVSEYENHCNTYFKKNRTKLKKLLSEDVPEGFIERQMNDSRYISKLVKGLLSNIVKHENEQAETSKYVIPVTGAITDKLKQDWGLHDKWNEIIAPRFKRMNELTDSHDFGYFDKAINTFRIVVPDDVQKGFNKKRIDHRHHAMDALVVACATRKHIQYLNALNNEKENYALRDSLLIKNKNGHYTKTFQLPWNQFPVDAKNAFEKVVVSFKQNLRVINKTNNKTWQWVTKNGAPKKQLVKQTKGENWAIRKPLHAPLPYGMINYKLSTLEISENVGKRKFIHDYKIKEQVERLFEEFNGKIGAVKKHLKKNPLKDANGREILITVFNIPEIRYRKRQPIEKLANRGQGGIKDVKQAIAFINKVSDRIIKDSLLLHLKENDYDIDKAFSIEGIEKYNSKRETPVYKLPIAEASTLKYPLGYTNNTKVKFGEAESGTNLFFAIYWNDEKQKREYETIPLKHVIEHQKQVAHLAKEERTPVPINNEKGTFLFSLSPNDLVYVPTQDEIENPSSFKFNH